MPLSALTPSCRLAPRRETVEVTGEAPQLQTDSADVGVSYNERYVENLPVFNRNFTAFELLSPGTQQLAGWNHAATENPQGGLQIFVNGQHFSGTGFQLDGTDNQDPILGIIVINPNLDAITQATVGSQFYDAEQGKAIAGLVTAQTKSGTNELHGSGFWFRRTDANEARDPFTQSAPNSVTGRFIPSDKWNQYGGTIGGPIIKNKLFFFGDYQGTKETTGVTNVLTVPTTQVVQSCTAATGFCNLSQYLGHVSGGGRLTGDGWAGLLPQCEQYWQWLHGGHSRYSPEQHDPGFPAFSTGGGSSEGLSSADQRRL